MDRYRDGLAIAVARNENLALEARSPQKEWFQGVAEGIKIAMVAHVAMCAIPGEYSSETEMWNTVNYEVAQAHKRLKRGKVS